MRPQPLVLAASLLAAATPAGATLVDTNWTETILSTNTGSSGHTGLAWAPDGSDRLFVIEKGGRVRILSGATTTTTPTWSTFATMSPIFTNSECGLIGIAFDPDFARNKYVYFFVTASSSEQQILRYDASTNTGTGRTVIVPGLPTNGNNHDGGGVGFALDGKLYWAVGDLGAGVGVDANLTSLASKVGRANRDGSLPADNPFDDGGGPNNDYIYARGFRNPFTLTVQPSTGQLWVNVVGDGYEQVFVVGRGDHAGYNDFENNQPAGFITPKIVYRTNGSDTRTITAAARAGGVSTFTTSGNHGFRVGTNLAVSGVADASFNQPTVYVASVPSATSFTAVQAGPDASSSGGSAVTLSQGGCLTGGGFYEGTLAPAAYRGNFFYGDCNSGRIMRARIDPATNAVQGIDYWATGIASQVDVTSGPDGALYYTGVGTSNIFRAAFNATAQGLVVANQNLRADEGGEVVTTVRLAIAPAADVTVTIARTSGDPDVGVVGTTSLVFTPANWNRPQAVRFAATADADLADDTATITFGSVGLQDVPLRLTVLDLGGIPDTLFANGFEP
jgi:glucose/arabinose dehydrogenase